MSVVNDVLRNIDQRKQPRPNLSNSDFYFQNSNSKSILNWFAFSVLIILSMVIITLSAIQLQANEKNIVSTSINLPDDLFSVNEGEVIEIEGDKSDIDSIKPIEKVDDTLLHRISVNKSLTIHSDDDLVEPAPKKITHVVAPTSNIKKNSSMEHEVVANETVTSKASEKVVTALNSGDIKSVESQVKLASQKVQNDVQIRRMMKHDPASVMPYLKNNFIHFSKSPSMLALAAQGEQRSGNHINAIQIYKNLIPMQPSDARWRAGLAISLEAMGDTERAKKLYRLALSMNNLPASLKRFSTTRLVSINQ